MTVPVLGEFCGFHQRPGSGVSVLILCGRSSCTMQELLVFPNMRTFFQILILSGPHLPDTQEQSRCD